MFLFEEFVLIRVHLKRKNLRLIHQFQNERPIAYPAPKFNFLLIMRNHLNVVRRAEKKKIADTTQTDDKFCQVVP